MFQVEHIVTGKTYTVYGQNGMYFLVWDQKTSCWTWILMGECAPVAEESCDAPYWATEQAYKNGFKAGKREAQKDGK